VIEFIHNTLTTRRYWLGLIFIGLFMEGTALYYQYVVGDEPCQICIHIRIWVAAFILLALVACLLPRNKILIIAAHLLNVVAMAGLWERCKYLMDVESGKGDSSCQFFLGFPDWFALDRWFPFIFEVRNLCGATPEMLWGLTTMSEALMVASSMLLLLSLVALGVNVFSRTQS